MVGECAVGQPVSPVGDRCCELLLGLVDVSGLVAGPGHRDEGRLPLLEGRAAVAAGADGTQTDGRRDGQHRVTDRRTHRHGLVAVSLVVPHSGLGPVLEHGHHIGDHLDVALDAGGQPQQGSGCSGVPGRPAVIASPHAVTDRLHHEEVFDDQPPRRGVPRRLEHHGARHIAPVVRHERPRGPEPKVAGRAVEEGAEHTGRVRPGQAQPLDRSVRSNKTAVLAVREEPVVGDGGKALGHRLDRLLTHIPNATDFPLGAPLLLLAVTLSLRVTPLGGSSGNPPATSVIPLPPRADRHPGPTIIAPGSPRWTRATARGVRRWRLSEGVGNCYSSVAVF